MNLHALLILILVLICGPNYPSSYKSPIQGEFGLFIYSREWAKHKRRDCLNLSLFFVVLVTSSPCSRSKILESRLELEKRQSESKQRVQFADFNGFARSRRVRRLGRPEPGFVRFVAPLWLRCPGIRGSSLSLHFWLSILFH
jgi:hypothetical protein